MLLEWLFNIRLVRWVAGTFFFIRGYLWLIAGNPYRGMIDLCWVSRVSGVEWIKHFSDIFIDGMIEKLKQEKENQLIASYLQNKASYACASLYSVAGGSKNIFRDVIVLKSAFHDENEKGVILLKYARTFEAVIALFDLRRLLDRYLFVLEPSWAGYCDPSILMFITPQHPVIVQCFTQEDYNFIENIGAPLIPIRLGPADWVDADLFTSNSHCEKQYDLVMVANWERHKRHAQLFKALSKINGRRIRVLLIGFQLGKRTADDIKREAAVIKSPLITIEIKENLPQKELVSYLRQCKVFVFLSRKEGDNKALVEAMFVGLPAIVYEKTIGGAKSRINQETGILASDEELSEKISYMLDHHQEFNPRNWINKHSGSSVSTKRLNDLLKQTVIESGGKWTLDIVEKVNNPNLSYKNPAQQAAFHQDYNFILACRRSIMAEGQSCSLGLSDPGVSPLREKTSTRGWLIK